MPLKTLLAIILFSLAGYAQPAQDATSQQEAQAELQRMMSRRADLLQQWRRFNLEENALFGGKSKKDLRNILETQQKIIELDNQILNFGKLENYEKKQSEKMENLQRHRSLYSRLDSLEQVNSRYDVLLKAAEKRESTARNQIAKQQSRNNGLALALVLVTGLLLVSLFYNPVKKKRRT